MTVALIVVSLYSCSNQYPIDMAKKRYIDSVKNRVVTLGDTEAYHILLKHFLEQDQNESLGFSLVMSNKYKYAPAYSDLANDLLDWYNVNQVADSIDLSSVDKSSRIMIVKYLLLSAKSGNASDSVKVNAIKSKTEYLSDIEEAQRQMDAW